MPRTNGSLTEQFKEFILKGNVLHLAVAFILGVAFSAVVSSLTDGVLMAIVAALFGKPSFDALTLGIGDGVIRYGAFLTATINFLIVAAVMFGIVKMASRFERPKTITLDEPSSPTEAELLSEIRDLLAADRRATRGR